MMMQTFAQALVSLLLYLGTDLTGAPPPEDLQPDPLRVALSV